MPDDIDRVLRSIERIAFAAMGLATAFLLLNTVIALGPDSYGRQLLNGLSVFMVIGAIILFLWVAYISSAASKRAGHQKEK